ncbi:MAG: M56 family metallopeptidase [Planctomycetota bacterium]|jgi:WD40 repeat protein/beta-lactamase regulating signal transducer with metallopeptidase domain
MIEKLLVVGLSNAAVAAALALIALAVTRIWRHAPLAHLLWLVVLVKLVTPPLFNLPIPIPMASESITPVDTDSLPPIPRANVGDSEALFVAPSSQAPFLLPDDADAIGQDSESVFRDDPRGHAANVERASIPVTTPEDHSLYGNFVNPWRALSRVVPSVWLAGALVVMAAALVRLYRFGWLLRRAAAAPPELREEVARLASVVGLRRVRDVRVTGARVAPLVFGVGAGSILLFPQALLSSLGKEERTTMFAHELAHLRRRDHWLTWFELLVVSLFWWYPVAWFARRQLHRAADQCCDGWVVKWFPDKALPYAESMMKAVDFLAEGGRPVAGLASGFGQVSSLKRRFEMVLGNRTSHCLALPLRLTVVPAAMLLLLFSPILILAEKEQDRTPSAREAEAMNGDFVRLPDKLVGQVEGEDGKPIADARVVIELKDDGAVAHLITLTCGYRIVRTWQATTDKQGRYEIDTSTLGPQPTHRHFDGRARSKGYAEYRMRYAWTVKTVVEKGRLAPVKMPLGRVVRGRVVDPDGKPPKNIVIQKGGMLQRNESWFPHPSAGKQDGTFAITVPKDVDVVFWVHATGWAPGHVKVPATTADVGDVVLRPGTIVIGRVLDGNGDPIPGVVVAMEGEQDVGIERARFSPNLATKTSTDGRFRLSPVVGKYKIWVTSGAATDDRIHERYLYSDRSPPLIAPQLIVLDGKEMQHEVNFRARSTLTVRGTIRWPDGKPVPHIGITTGTIMEGARGGITLGHALSDEDGGYEIELPKPMRDVHISVVGAKDAAGKWHEAFPVDAVRAHRKHARFMTFKLLEDDLDEADWQLRPLNLGQGFPVLPQPAKESLPESSVTKALPSVRVIFAHDAWARFVAWSPDGKTLASGSLLGGPDELALWDPQTGEAKWRVEMPRGEPLCSLAFSLDGTTLAIGAGGKVLLRDVDTGRLRRTLIGHGGACVFCCAFSPDGNTLATGGGRSDNTIRLWGLASGELKGTLSGHRDEVLSVTFSDDGKTLLSAAGRDDPTVRIWDVDASKLRRTIHEFAGTWLQAFSPDGEVFAEARSGGVFLWDLRSGKLKQALKTRFEESRVGAIIPWRMIQTISFSPNGRLVAAGDDSGFVEVWDARSGDLRQSFTAGRHVSSIAFSPHAMSLAAGTRDGRINIWRIDQNQPDENQRQGAAGRTSRWEMDLARHDPDLP